MDEVPACTAITEIDENTLSFMPGEFTISVETFWELWHQLRTEVGVMPWKTEYVDKNRDYDMVQTRYLEASGQYQPTDPFADADGFVDAGM